MNYIFFLLMLFANLSNVISCEARRGLLDFDSTDDEIVFTFSSTEIKKLTKKVDLMEKEIERQKQSQKLLIQQIQFCNIFEEIKNYSLNFSEIALSDLVFSRLNNDMIINSLEAIFSGRGKLYNYEGTLVIIGGVRLLNFFTTHFHSAEVYRTSLYEKLEIFLDTVFGLKSGKEGLPPPCERKGSLSTLLSHKFDFVIGLQRDGKGQRYGYNNSTNHFSDHPLSQAIFPGLRNGQNLEIDSSKGVQKVTDFFNSYEVLTDYERLKILFDVITKIKT